MKTVNVELMTFGHGKVRPVELPDNVEVTLDNVFIFGQNNSENNHLNLPSVSVGDIIHLDSEKYVVKDFGFEKLSSEVYSHLKLKTSLQYKVYHLRSLDYYA
jgi:hypothetical protein